MFLVNELKVTFTELIKHNRGKFVLQLTEIRLVRFKESKCVYVKMLTFKMLFVKNTELTINI